MIRGYRRCGNSLAQSFDPRSIQTSLKETVRVGCDVGRETEIVIAGDWNACVVKHRTMMMINLSVNQTFDTEMSE